MRASPPPAFSPTPVAKTSPVQAEPSATKAQVGYQDAYQPVPAPSAAADRSSACSGDVVHLGVRRLTC